MRNRWAVFCAVLALIGCGKKKEELPALEDVEALRTKYAAYHDASAADVGAREGFVADQCDDLLFTGLRSLVAPETDLTKAQLAPGEWTRRRVAMPECYPDHSASRISRDMLLGVAWWAHVTGQKGAAADIVGYADANEGIMGPGLTSRTQIRAQLYGTFAKLAGLKKPEAAIPLVVTGLELGFERHLAAWHLLLRARLNGGMDEGYVWWLRKMADAEPGNALFAFLVARYDSGDYAKTLAILLDETHWPADRLPTNVNHCTPWVWEHDAAEKAWAPCEKDAQWSGSDWLVVARLVLDAAG